MDNDAIRDAFYECQDFEEVEGGKYDDQGFYRLPDGGFYDPDGVQFDKDGKDKYGGYYDEEFNYHPGQEYLDMVKILKDEHAMMEQYGLAEQEEWEGEGYYENEGEEETKDAKEFKDYITKEKIEPTLEYIKNNPTERFIFISFKGMSAKKDDAKAYKEWFNERQIKVFDIAINASRLNAKIKTEEEESIINAIWLEGTPDVDIIKVYLPFLSSEKVGVKDEEEDDIEEINLQEENDEEKPKEEEPKEEEPKEEKPKEDKSKVDKPKEESKVVVEEGDEFEITNA